VIDELLGRADLKAEIERLEEENERLRRRYEAESDRRAEATTARQEAERRINRLEDRIAGLEGELERSDEELDLEYRRRERLRGRRLSAVLDRLESFRADGEGALTATVRGTPPDPVAEALDERAALAADAAPCLVCLDDAGLVSAALSPPLVPDVAPTWDDRFRLEREWFLPTGRYVLALVRADLFALGVYEGERRREFRGFESGVKGDHSKGGFSQARFERIRDEQIDDHLGRVRDVLAEYADERLYVVGQRGAVDAVAADADATAAVDATGTPEPALEDAFRSFWTTELRVI